MGKKCQNFILKISMLFQSQLETKLCLASTEVLSDYNLSKYYNNATILKMNPLK